MQCEILMIGTELLLGQIVDTNAAFMGRALAEHGINLYQKTTVGDNPERIRDALDAALDRSDVVLTSGGLGPTEDDITRECIADLLGRPLEFRQDLYDDLAALFERFRYVMTENNKKQAYAPRGAASIPNPNGTAPGLIVEDARGTIICMPGVPGELKPMLTDSVIPYLKRTFGIEGLIHSRVLKVCGIGESRIDAAIGDLIKTQQNPTVGVLAYPDAVQIRITARVATREEADALLQERGWTLAVAETVTGGVIAQRFTAARAVAFRGGVVIPIAQLDVGDAGARADELAEKVRATYGASCGLALVADHERRNTASRFHTPEERAAWEAAFAGTDERSQLRAGVVALEYVRRYLCGVSAP